MTKKQIEFLKTIKHGGCHSFYKRAFESGLLVEEIKEDTTVVKISDGKKTYYMRRQTIPLIRRQGQLTRNKHVTKAILKDAGIRVPNDIVIDANKNGDSDLKNSGLKFPLIVKPQNGSRAAGVSWDVKNFKEMKNAIKFASKVTKGPVLVEEMFIGSELRVLVFNDMVLSAVHKVPAAVTGDGVSTIRELIEKFNQSRREAFKIVIDDIVKSKLKEGMYTFDTVLPKNFFLPLRNNLNMSDGGRSINVTNQVDNKYLEICIKAVFSLGLQFGGVDIIVKNIEKFGPYTVLEVNPNPFFNMHEVELVEGAPIDVSAAILEDLFPDIKIKASVI